LLPAFKEVVRLLGEGTLFPCTNNQQATKARIKDTRTALRADRWKLEFPGLDSSARAELIRALETLEEARSRKTEDSSHYLGTLWLGLLGSRKGHEETRVEWAEFNWLLTYIF
jgi:hypothetical protein